MFRILLTLHSTSPSFRLNMTLLTMTGGHLLAVQDEARLQGVLVRVRGGRRVEDSSERGI